MAFDSTAFLNDLTNGVQLDTAATAALQSALANPTIAKRLEESTLRQSDYSRKQDDYTKKLQAAQDYWDSLVKWDKDAKASLDRERQTIRQKLAADPDGLGNLNDDAARQPVAGVGQDELKKLAQESLAYMNTAMVIGLKHYKEFGEIIDPNALIDHATKEGTNIQIAYDRMVQPKRDEINKADIEKQLAKAREEGKAEALKNVQLPINEQPFSNAMPSAVEALSKTNEVRASEYGSMAAIKAWKENRTKINPLPF